MCFDALFVLCLSFGAMCMDVLTGKVANEWILFGWGTGMVLQLWKSGIYGALHFFSGSCLPLLLLFPLFWFRMLGAGDIKVLSVLGGILGIRSGWRCICCSFLLGAVFSLLILIFCGNLKERIQYFLHYLSEYQRTGKRVPYSKAGARMENYPFTIPILLATVFYVGGLY